MAERSADAIMAAVEATGLLASDGTVLLMCSAGRDSHCLLDIAVRLRGAGAVQVLHVDHGLRKGAATDARQMRERCEALGAGFVVRSPGPRGADGDERNLHAWARAARAELAAAEQARVGADLVATAHTRTDLVETALGRLATQPGRRALLAMRGQEGPLVRPLLAAGVTRAETATYCRARGLTWREDPSNADRRFARARLRHEVLPVLRSLNPQAEDAIARTLTELAEEREVLDSLVEAELTGADADTTLGHGAGPSIALARLAGLPHPLGRLVLRELCERSLGAPCPRAAQRLGDVLALGSAAARQGAGSVDVGGGARVELRAGTIRCRRSEGPAAPYTPPGA